MIHPLTGERPAEQWQVRMGGSSGVVGSFGYTRTDNDGRAKQHLGVDWLCEEWTPVYAAHSGVIRRAGFERNSNGSEVNEGYGSRIILTATHDRLETRYAHLALQIYKERMFVSEGALIGLVGRTGSVSHHPDIPTHLHHEIRVDGEPVDPVFYYHRSGSRLGVPEPDRGAA